MGNALVISVRFHDGRYHGSPEWPPSPARLFQAFVAAAASSGRLIDDDVKALGWLESDDVSPPTVAVPLAREGSGIKSYVPNNDMDSVNGDLNRVAELRTAKTIKPWLFDAETPLLYLWRFPSNGAKEPFAARVCSIAERLYQFGRGVDMAWAWGEILDEAEADNRLREYPGAIHRACAAGSGTALACPLVGSLKSLMDRHSAQSMRFTSSGDRKKSQQIFSQPPKAWFKQIPYDSLTTRQLYELRGSSAPWPMTRCAELVRVLRDKSAERLIEALPKRQTEIERVLIGRGAAEADKTMRVRILPIPSIGHEHADRAIRRVLVEIPPNCPIRPPDIAWTFSGLAPQFNNSTGEVQLDLVSATDQGMTCHYGAEEGRDRRYRYWKTVTPAVLPERAARRRIDPNRMRQEGKGGPERVDEQNRAASAVLGALRHADIHGRVEVIRIQREPFDAKGQRAEAFAIGTRFAKERMWHVEIGFAEPHTGPLVIGDGRYSGLGLMCPFREPTEGVRCFAIKGGLADIVNPIECSRALRAAVMARVQSTLGPRAKLPTFFTGHKPDGAPSREGRHGHLAFVADLARSRFLVIAPHVLEGRLPTRYEHGFCETLDSSIHDLSDLRAGASGRLKLVPALINVDEDPLFAASRCWQSASDYHPTRYAKRKTSNEAMIFDVRSEIIRRQLPMPSRIDVIELRTGPRGALAGRLRLHFATAVSGLILIGRSRHFGGGLFSAVNWKPGSGAITGILDVSAKAGSREGITNESPIT